MDLSRTGCEGPWPKNGLSDLSALEGEAFAPFQIDTVQRQRSMAVEERALMMWNDMRSEWSDFERLGVYPVHERKN